jgi:hypothetical protein
MTRGIHNLLEKVDDRKLHKEQMLLQIKQDKNLLIDENPLP